MFYIFKFFCTKCAFIRRKYIIFLLEIFQKYVIFYFRGSPPLKLEGGVLIFEIWKKRGSQKNCPEVGGLVERGRGGVLLERGDFQIVSSLFLKKSMFSLL